MATQSNNLMLLDASGFPRVIDTATDSLQVGVATEFTQNVAVGGNLTVTGDIVARSTINLVIQDSFIDLGVGNTTTDKTPAGFSFNIAANVDTVTTVGGEDISAFTAGGGGQPPKMTASAGSEFAANDILVLTGSSDGSNDGLYVVLSVDAGGVISLKGVGAASQPDAAVPWARTQVDTLTGQVAKAYKADIAVMVVADATSFLDGSGGAYPEGAFLQAFAADATEPDFSGLGDYSSMGAGSTTLQAAYDAPGGNTITTDGSGAILFTLDTVAGRGFTVKGSDAGVIALGLSANKVGSIDMQSAGAIGATAAGAVLMTGASFSASATVGSFALSAAGALATTDTTAVSLDAVSAGSLNIGASSVVAENAPINIGTNLARVLSVGSASAASLSMGAVDIDISAGISGVAIESASAGSIDIGTSADTAPINMGTAAARVISVGSASATSLDLDAADVNMSGAATLDLESLIIQIGANGAGKSINIGEASAANPISIDAGLGAYAIKADAASSMGVSAGTLDIDSSADLSLNSGAAINIGNDNVAQPVNLATGAAARVISLGNAASTSLSMDALDTNLSGVNTLDLESLAIQIGANGAGKSINIGEATQANPITIDAGTSAYTIDAALDSKLKVDGSNASDLSLNLEVVNAAGPGFIVSTADVVKSDGRHEFASEAGISAKSGGALAAGRVCIFKTMGGLSKVVHASADATNELDRALHVTTWKSMVVDEVGSYGGVSGTVSHLEFNAAPAAGDVGKVVYLFAAGVTATNEGKVTLTAPTIAASTVFKIGILTDSTAVGGLYSVLLQPAFIAKRP